MNERPCLSGKEDDRKKRKERMEVVIFALIGTRNETFVPEPADFQPFDLRALRHLYNAEDNAPRRRSNQKTK